MELVWAKQLIVENVIIDSDRKNLIALINGIECVISAKNHSVNRPLPHPSPSQNGARKSLCKSLVDPLQMLRISGRDAKCFPGFIFLSQITHILAIP